MKIKRNYINGYKPCNEEQAKVCIENDMLWCDLCPHGVEVKDEYIEIKEIE